QPNAERIPRREPPRLRVVIARSEVSERTALRFVLPPPLESIRVLEETPAPVVAVGVSDLVLPERVVFVALDDIPGRVRESVDIPDRVLAEVVLLRRARVRRERRAHRLVEPDAVDPLLVLLRGRAPLLDDPRPVVDMPLRCRAE